MPTIKSCAKECKILEKGLKLYYSNQCPYTEKYVKIIKEIADSRGLNLEINKYENAKQAQNAPSLFTTYSFFFNGNFVTNEILTEKNLLDFLMKMIYKLEA